MYLRGMRNRLVLVAAALLSVAAAKSPGEKAPDFSRPASDGRTISLKDFAGKKTVVLAFFPKAFTGG
jgi:thioredoxin-dependent peroxiredoxin